MKSDRWVWYALGLIFVATAFVAWRLYGKAGNNAR